MRTCGGCTLCCSLLAVAPLRKAANTACVHCDGSGCRLFDQDERPAMCATYACAWLWNEAWPEALRPDRCHVVFEPFGDRCVAVAVDLAYPDALKVPIVQAACQRFLRDGWSVIAIVGNTKHVLLADGASPLGIWREVDRALRTTWQQPPTPRT